METAHDLFTRLAAQGAMIDRLSSDSRRCAPGVAFFAYPGEKADGRVHIGEAIARGAAAVAWDNDDFAWRPEWQAPHVAVRGLKMRTGELAHEFYGRPSESLWMCGVTGTNGKTSSSHWIAALLGAAGEKTGLIGTLGSGFPGALDAEPNTTPDALEVHRLLRDFLGAGASCAAMEVSSHGLVQGRVNAVAFDCALFTNVSHDHLDYHGSMEAYGEAKARLFETAGLGAAVLNLDDVFGVQLARRLTARGLRTIGYSLSPAAVAPGSVSEFIAARAIDAGRLELVSSWGEASIRFGQIGRFNVSNALGVLGCLVAHRLPFAQCAKLLESLPPVPGRMERIAERPLVVVDYAHTPDALEKVLTALAPLASARGGRLSVVFGAGGDRDAAKRPVMGEIAARIADQVWLTSDNPRSEDPLAIIRQIQAGIAGAHEIEPSRERAIERAVRRAAPNDVVLIAGKGHEDYQEIAGKRLPFSDAVAARAALSGMGRA